ncbi:MAG TPA: glycerol-3-phosphate 1-O-acyltransferase PlsY [Burkholderiales bacterium]|nr:glycerol-3-phosphate 1-O-acyltransferase PlsY [Burkholderiales bacterium]
MNITLLFLMFAGYLIGSLSFAIIISRAFQLPDPRTFGSGNPGATNVLRSGNKKAAALTLFGDAIKGWLTVFLAQKLAGLPGIGAPGIAWVAIAAFIGHLYPIYFQFRGGKGVATALGILLAFSLKLGICVALVWLIVAKLFRISSLSALAATISAPFFALIFLTEPSWKWSVCAIALILIARHKTNIQKLLSGKETKIGN